MSLSENLEEALGKLNEKTIFSIIHVNGLPLYFKDFGEGLIQSSDLGGTPDSSEVSGMVLALLNFFGELFKKDKVTVEDPNGAFEITSEIIDDLIKGSDKDGSLPADAKMPSKEDFPKEFNKEFIFDNISFFKKGNNQIIVYPGERVHSLLLLTGIDFVSDFVYKQINMFNKQLITKLEIEYGGDIATSEKGKNIAGMLSEITETYIKETKTRIYMLYLKDFLDTAISKDISSKKCLGLLYKLINFLDSDEPYDKIINFLDNKVKKGINGIVVSDLKKFLRDDLPYDEVINFLNKDDVFKFLNDHTQKIIKKKIIKLGQNLSGVIKYVNNEYSDVWDLFAMPFDKLPILTGKSDSEEYGILSAEDLGKPSDFIQRNLNALANGNEDEKRVYIQSLYLKEILDTAFKKDIYPKKCLNLLKSLVGLLHSDADYNSAAKFNNVIIKGLKNMGPELAEVIKEVNKDYHS
jgi:hypothetical protein